ncbi:MAG: hypothetical protein ACRD12_21065 [Acidimicrobiales bacterium]
MDWMLAPADLLPDFDFTLTGALDVAGRAAIGARAVPRPLGHGLRFGPWTAQGADEVMLAVDRQSGVLLRAESRLQGAPFVVQEVTSLVLDEPLDDEVFRFVSPDGSPVRSPREAFSRPEEASVEEVARRASFTVLLPGRLPEGWTIEVSYLPPSVRPPRPESATLHLLDGRDAMPRARVREAAEPLPDVLDWTELVRDGRRILVDRDEAKAEIEGTHVRATGNVERDALVDIVASLRPVPRELPPLRDL